MWVIIWFILLSSMQMINVSINVKQDLVQQLKSVYNKPIMCLIILQLSNFISIS